VYRPENRCPLHTHLIKKNMIGTKKIEEKKDGRKEEKLINSVIRSTYATQNAETLKVKESQGRSTEGLMGSSICGETTNKRARSRAE